MASLLISNRDKHPHVLALARGGVPIGFEISTVLNCPLDVLAVRKVGIVGDPEFGIGAISEGGVRVLDHATIEIMEIDQKDLNSTIELQELELQKMIKLYRDGKPLPDLTGKTSVIVDDGMATGISARAAIEAVKKLNPNKIIIATPVCPLDTRRSLQVLVDNVICLASPYQFSAVGVWYKNFEQVSDEEVVKIINQTRSDA